MTQILTDWLETEKRANSKHNDAASDTEYFFFVFTLAVLKMPAKTNDIEQKTLILLNIDHNGMKRNTDKCENLRLEKEIYCWFLNTLWKKNIYLIYLIKQFRVVRDEYQITATLATFKYVQVRESEREQAKWTLTTKSGAILLCQFFFN